MARQTDEIPRRPFTQDEHQAMINVGVLSPNEQSVLHDGQIFVRLMDARHYWTRSDDPGPTAGEVPVDAVVMERSRVFDQVEEVLAQMSTQTTDEFIPRRFNVAEYYAMAEAGILRPDERVELLAGEVIIMAPMGSRHAACINDFNEQFQEQSGRRVTKCVQTPLRLDEICELEPDLMLVQRRDDSYASEHPTAADVLLIIEVADTTIGADRLHKLPIYARFGIPETWLADLNGHRVEVHTEPRDGVYARVEYVEMDGILAPSAFLDIAIPVKDVIPA